MWAAHSLHFVATLTRIPLTDSGLNHGRIQGRNEFAEDSARTLEFFMVHLSSEGYPFMAVGKWPRTRASALRQAPLAAAQPCQFAFAGSGRTGCTTSAIPKEPFRGYVRSLRYIPEYPDQRSGEAGRLRVSEQGGAVKKASKCGLRILYTSSPRLLGYP